MNKILLFSLVSFLSFAQSKKEQIIILTGKIDSLKYENFNHKLKISELKNQNTELINSNSKLLQENQSFISEKDSLKLKYKKEISEKEMLINKLKLLKDSIQTQQSIFHKKTDWEKWKLNGKVKSLITYYWKGDTFNDDYCSDTYGSSNIDLFFNESGYKIEEKRYSTQTPLKRNLEIREINTFDSIGNKIESKSYDNYGKLLSISRYSLGREIETKIFNEYSKIVYRYTMAYDEQGNKIEEKQFNEKEILYSHKRYYYDIKGNIIEEISFVDGVQQLHLKYKIEYYE